MAKRRVTREELDRPMVPYNEAVSRILAPFSPLPPVRTAASEALGLVIAGPVVSEIDVPGFDNSAMDGYAVRASDTPGRLRLVDELPAGVAPTVEITAGTAATIMTGAPIPPGADAVVPWEDTTAADGAVDVRVSIPSGKHVRPRGEDVRAGEMVIEAGSVLGPVALGVIASLGLTHVLAHPRPRVAILSTGDELVPPGGRLQPGQVFDANRAVIAAMCEREGFTVSADALIQDDPSAIAGWLSETSADLVVTTGGASVGEHDWIRSILEKEGTLSLWRVAIKPGKPVAFGSFGGTPVLGLPGNPGSAFVGVHVFVLPALRTLAGRSPSPRRVQARLSAAVRGSPSRTSFARVRLKGDMAEPLPAQSSVVLSNLLPADGFAVVAPGGASEGAIVTVELLA